MTLPFLPSDTETFTHLDKAGYLGFFIFGVHHYLLPLTDIFVGIFKYEPGNKAVTCTAFHGLSTSKSKH